MARRATAGLCAAVMAGSLLSAPLSLADTPANKATPGMSIYSGTLGDPSTVCTAGFLVTQWVKEGPKRRGMLTAGHCYRPREDSPLAYFKDPSWKSRQMGEFSKQEYEEDRDGNSIRDAALVILTTPKSTGLIGNVVKLSDALPVDEIAVGDEACMWGGTTNTPGKTPCGKIVDVTLDRIVVSGLSAQRGDSGAPVWSPRPDGTNAAIGMVSSAGKEDDLVRVMPLYPILERWDLSVDIRG